ncbi:hypothetical protein GCM10009862_03950 [Microbacterium binotii]|uniref:Uncharacterized protein n=1 Tax=Microbacterium binotii TaxID=462710 RepID=A0ABN3P5U1_9MICO
MAGGRLRADGAHAEPGLGGDRAMGEPALCGEPGSEGHPAMLRRRPHPCCAVERRLWQTRRAARAGEEVALFSEIGAELGEFGPKPPRSARNSENRATSRRLR